MTDNSNIDPTLRVNDTLAEGSSNDDNNNATTANNNNNNNDNYKDHLSAVGAEANESVAQGVEQDAQSEQPQQPHQQQDQLTGIPPTSQRAPSSSALSNNLLPELSSVMNEANDALGDMLVERRAGALALAQGAVPVPPSTTGGATTSALPIPATDPRALTAANLQSIQYVPMIQQQQQEGVLEPPLPQQTGLMTATTTPGGGNKDVLPEAMFSQGTIATVMGAATTTGAVTAAGGAVGAARPRTTLESLFGPTFAAQMTHEVDAVAEPVDPTLLDTLFMLGEVAGGAFTESDAAIIMEYAPELEKHVEEQRHEEAYSRLDELFGKTARFLSRSQMPSMMLSAAYPAPLPSSSATEAATATERTTVISNRKDPLQSQLLLTLPTVHPNCQVLHFDPVPFNPITHIPPPTSKRRLFTPRNVMLWNYEPKTRQYLSNARIVQWSDGTSSLHVGGEMYDVLTFTDAGLTFVAEERPMFRCDRAVSSLVETIPVDNHVTVRHHDDTRNSIDELTVAKAQQRRTANTATKIGVLVSSLSSVLPPSGSSSGKKGHARRNVIEEFLENQRAELQRHADKMASEGKPLTLAEKLALDAEMCAAVDRAVAAGTLTQLMSEAAARRQSEKSEVHTQQMVGSGRLRVPGSKFDRHIAFDSGDDGNINNNNMNNNENNNIMGSSTQEEDSEQPTTKQRRVETPTTTTPTTTTTTTGSSSDTATVLPGVGNAAATAAVATALRQLLPNTTGDTKEIILYTAQNIEGNCYPVTTLVRKVAELKQDVSSTDGDAVDFSSVEGALRVFEESH